MGQELEDCAEVSPIRSRLFPVTVAVTLFLVSAIFRLCRLVFISPYFRHCSFFIFTSSGSEMNVSYVRAGSLSSCTAVLVLNKRKYKLHNGRLRFM